MEIKVNALTKNYGKKIALNDLNITLENGIYALLGPNGAGKTTFINILVGVLNPSDGEIMCDGIPVKKCEREFLGRIGYLPQTPSFYKQFTAADFLKYMGVLKGIEKERLESEVDSLLEAVNLADVKKKRLGTFSGGMLQRIGIAEALLGDPELLIFDEPTAGLDPKERIRFKNLLSKLSKDKIIILATHIVSDVEFLANRVVLLKEGKLISFDSPAKLIEGVKPYVWELSVGSDELDKYMNKLAISGAVYEEGFYRLHIVSAEKPAAGAVNVPPTLNDVYLNCFGEGNI